jgi:DNA-binding transcriptional MerR regulator
MNTKILTLFGEEEHVPEQLKAIGKSRSKPKKEKPTVAQETEEEKPNNIIPILNDWKPIKQYYSIGEVAELFGIATSHIRFWTTEFNMKVRTTRKGDRLYTTAQVYELRNIYHLVKQKGFTLNGAKAKLKEKKKNITESVNLKQSLLHLRNLLTEINNRL